MAALSLLFDITARDNASKTLRDVGNSADDAGKKSDGFGKAIGVAFAAAGAAALAAGASLYKVGETFDQMKDTIVVGTGASGKALDGLYASAKTIGQNVPSSFEDVGTAVADLNTRLGLTGKPLEDMSAQFLNMSRITGTDLSSNISGITRVFGDWGIAAEDQSETLDKLFFASQSTGIGIDELSSKVVQFGAPMRQLGFSFNESVALFGSFDKAGVNTETVMAGLRAGLGKMAKAGEAPVESFKRIVGEIAAAGSAGEANGLALQAFGQRAGPDMAAAIREGRFDITELAKSLDGAAGSIAAADMGTRDFAEQWQMFKNKVLVWLEPVAARVFGGLSTAMELVTQATTAFGAAWRYNDGEITSSGLNGYMERFGFIARQAFDYIRDSVIPTLVDFGGWIKRNSDIILPFIAALGAGYVVFQTITAITKAWAAAQAALNVVMAMNPIGLVIVAVAALVAGLVIAYQRSETFRAIVDAAFRAIAEAGRWMWENVLQPAFSALVAYWTVVAQGIAWAWDNLIKPAWAAVVAYVTFMWNNVLKPYFALILDVWTAVARGVMWAWDNLIQPAWTAVVAYVKFMWDNVLKPYFGFILDVWTAVARGVMWAWENVIRPAWNAVSAAARFLWDNVLSPVFSAIRTGWEGMGNGLRWIYDYVIAPIWGVFRGGVEGLQSVFSTVVGGIRAIWDGLVEAVKAPIRITFNFVNDWMIGPINSLLGALPGNLRIPLLPRLAEGGLVRGPGTGTSDSVLGIDPRSGLPTAWVSNGEMVVNAEATKRNRALLEAINSGTIAEYRRGGEVGGPFDIIGDAAGWVGGKIGDAASWVADMAVKGARKVAEAVLNPLRDAAKRLTPADAIGNMLDGGIDYLVNAVLGKSDEYDQAGGEGGPLGSGPAGSSWASIWNKVKAQFPTARMTSNYRAGDPGYHGKGKAVDVAGARPGDAAAMLAINRWAAATMGSNLSQLIYTPGVNLLNGKPHTYNAATRADHYDHVHMATYDQGGLLRPGYTLAFNGTGKNETIRTAGQEAALDRQVVININGTFDLASSRDLRRAAETMERELVKLGRERS